MSIRRILLPALLLALVQTMTGCSVGDGFFYLPNNRDYGTPKDQPYEEVQFASADGTKLTGWFVPAKGSARGTVVQFHGNAANKSIHYQLVSWLPPSGFNVFVFDYRGYGSSQGTPSHQGAYEDAVAALKYLKTRPDIDQRKIIVLGQSLGGALAISVVGAHPVEGIVGVVDDSGFSSYRDVARDHYGLLAPLVVSPGQSPVQAAPKISPIPLLIIHAQGDGTVPYYHARAIYDAAREPKELWTIPGNGHIDALSTLAPEYAPRLHKKFVEWTAAVPDAAAPPVDAPAEKFSPKPPTP